MTSEKEMDRDWVSLGDYVMDLVEQKKTDSPEFQTLARVFGIEKLREIYKKKKGEKK